MGFDISDNWDDYPEYRISGLVWRKRLFGGGYVTKVRGQKWKIRLNNFPDEPLYTLFVNGKQILHFTQWPSEWTK